MGEKTLLDQVTYLSPATVLRYDGAETDRQEYWAPTFDTRPRTSFGQNVASAYRSCLGDAASTMDDASVSMWLSGGLDSRAMVGELAERFPDMRTFTYDANPSGGGNLRIARDVADTLGIANETVDLTPGPLVEHFEDAVTLTDGMLGWKTFLNLTASFAVEDPGDVLLEACGQGGMMGDGIGRAAIELSSSPADALYRAKHKVDAETVETLLSGDADPMITYQQAVDGVDQDGYAETVLGAYYRNYFPRGDFASNKLVRARTGTRVPLAHGEFLDAVTKMPLKCRVGWVPGTRGAVPYGTAAAKLGLVRRLDSALDSIPYERTKVAPERPLWQHAAGFVFHTGIRRLRGETTYGGAGWRARGRSRTTTCAPCSSVCWRTRLTARSSTPTRSRRSSKSISRPRPPIGSGLSPGSPRWSSGSSHTTIPTPERGRIAYPESHRLIRRAGRYVTGPPRAERRTT
ncbi:asparagine synthase-related protein [Halobaculum halobium]|uniref:asparagine synthase-related protein n=1 Tax=Halobaculum halobium TaxID=3032281 RepID=UPI00361F8BCA